MTSLPIHKLFSVGLTGRRRSFGDDYSFTKQTISSRCILKKFRMGLLFVRREVTPDMIKIRTEVEE